MNKSFTHYKNIYENFVISLNQSITVTKFARHYLDNFPNNLPHDTREAFERELSKLAQLTIDSLEESGGEKVDLRLEFPAEDDLAPLVILAFTYMNFGIDVEDINFDRITLSQRLIMIFAYLDAFLGDTIRTICTVEPSILKTNKNLTWETIINLGSFDAVFEKMIDEFTFNFGWKNIYEKIEFLSERIGLDISIPEEELRNLLLAENIRHAFIHNGGKITQIFLDKFPGEFEASVGDQIPIDDKYIRLLEETVINLGGYIFSSVCEKFYSIDPQNTENVSIHQTGHYDNPVA